jgi:hypothetical protein
MNRNHIVYKDIIYPFIERVIPPERIKCSDRPIGWELGDIVSIEHFLFHQHNRQGFGSEVKIAGEDNRKFLSGGKRCNFILD